MKKRILLLSAAVLALAGCGGTTPVTPSSAPAESSSQGVTSSEAPVVISSEEIRSSEQGTSSQQGGTSSAAATSSQGGASSSAAASSSQGGVDIFTDGIVRIYFHNDTGTEKAKRIYVWCDGVDGTEFDWTGYDNSIGAYYDVDIREEPYKGKIAGSLSFIIKNPGSWNGQSADTVVKFSDFLDGATILDDGTVQLHIYACPGEGSAIETYSDQTDALGDYFKSFGATSDWNYLTAVGSGKIKDYILYCFDETYLRMNSLNRAEHLEEYRIKDGTCGSTELKIKIDGGVDPQKTYRLVGTFESNPAKKKKKVATFDNLYSTSKFTSQYTYSGDDLGAKYTPAKTEFRVWAPIATMVRVNIYDTGTPAAYSGNPLDDMPYPTAYLTKQSGGVFTGTIEMDLKGFYYTYTLFYNETNYETIDPYAHACGLNGLRGAILDFSETNPTGWNTLSYKTNITKPNQLTVYEVHVRDFTKHETWVSNEGNKPGTYNAFAELGTSYRGVTTGLSHLAEMGVNAVQLLPVYDQDNDERTIKEVVNGQEVVTEPGYNWGYNPQNYNCVEGSYSTDPANADVRVKEYKNMIAALAKQDIRVIMDVVYNHVSSVTKHSFSTICPRYFFRYDKDYNLIDDSGVGNAVNSERPMSRKYIIDSVKWWASEYKIKGFRFDLMGVLDTTTMRQLKDALYAIDPSIVVYGEGWTGGSTSASSPAKTDETYSLLKDNGKGSVGCFNDCGRDGSKGNTVYSNVIPADGWISEGSNVDNVYNTLTQVLGQNRWVNQRGIATDPTQTVNYVACHDNYTLYDQVNYLWHKNDASAWKNGTHTYVMEACANLQAISLFGQGIGFINGGDEFFRQKLIKRGDEMFDDMVESYKYGRYNQATGATEYQTTPWPQQAGYSYWIEGDGIKVDNDTWLVRNSYKYGDACNAFDWSRKVTYNAQYQGFKNIVQLRKAEMGNALGMTKSQIDAGKTWCWDYNDLFDDQGQSKTDIIAAGFKGQKDGKNVYMLANKGNVNMATIGIGNAKFEILYSSNAKHTVGEQFTVTNNLMGVYKNEVLIVREIQSLQS